MPKFALAGCGIAITRPADQATKLSKSITDAGGKPFLFPLIAIAPLEDYSVFEQKLATLCKYDWAIFISSNAVQNAMPRLLNKLSNIPKHLKFAAIGPSTAAELAKFGVENTLIPQDRFDSEALLALPEMLHVVDKHIMIFRGVGGREVLADTLKTRGATVDFAECYHRVNSQKDANILASMWQNKQLSAIIVTSSEAMRYLLAMADHGHAAWIKDIVLCVNHARIAEEPQRLGLTVAVTEAPGDEAMLQCLSKALNP